ncbi:MAG TPA: ATP-binding protein [Capillimicrobium sp.]
MAARQHQAIVELGELALGGLGSAALAGRAVEAAARTLGLAWAAVRGEGLDAEHGTRPAGAACASVPVPVAPDARATLSGCAPPGRELGDDEVSFLRSVANILAATVRRERSDAALLASREQLRAVLDNTEAVIYIKGPDLRYRLVNRRFRELFGEHLPETGGFTTADIVDAHTSAAITANDRHVLQTGEPIEVEQAVPTPGGEERVYVSLMFPVRDGRGGVAGVGGIAVDVSERRRAEREREALEARMHQAQRLESVGQLAGGIAHDFNNLLAVIRNYAGFIADELPEGTQARDDVEQVRRATERATALTQQLLLFSRQELARAEVLDINAAVLQTEQLLRRTLGAQVALHTDLGEGLPRVEIDPGLVEHVLINLALNARDAMPAGGSLTIRTAPRSDGAGAVLEVADTGAGMAPEVVARAQEPFFTTKPQGEGTGLGLATAHGVVARAGGTLELRSAPGAGTVVTIALPAAPGSAAATGGATVAEEGARGDGRTVLVVEDEEALRTLVVRVLTGHGYAVVAAADAREALAVAERPDLLLTDVVMPGMPGNELAEELRRRWPGLPVLLMSGYTDEADLRGSGVLAKPFDAQALLRRVGASLAGSED